MVLPLWASLTLLGLEILFGLWFFNPNGVKKLREKLRLLKEWEPFAKGR